MDLQLVTAPAPHPHMLPSLRLPAGQLWALEFAASGLSSPESLSGGPGVGQEYEMWTTDWL